MPRPEAAVVVGEARENTHAAQIGPERGHLAHVGLAEETAREGHERLDVGQWSVDPQLEPLEPAIDRSAENADPDGTRAAGKRLAKRRGATRRRAHADRMSVVCGGGGYRSMGWRLILSVSGVGRTS